MADPEPYELALERITLAMTSSLDRGSVLETVTAGLVDELDAAAAMVWLAVDDDPSRLTMAAHGGLEAAEREAPLRIRDVATTGNHFCGNSLPTDGTLGPPAWLLENGLRAAANLPLTIRDKVLGVLSVYFKRHISDARFSRLAMFARTASVAIDNARLLAEVREFDRKLTAENQYLRQEVQRDTDCGEIVGRSDAIRKVLDQAAQVATTDASVLIYGETGTGKELIAHTIHQQSPRHAKPLVKINCGAISAGLVESELFGHEKGSFTGALEQRIGRFELADGGTLFLDEVGELPLETQVKLLRALQEQEFERVGSSSPIRVDVRIIAAGNRDLAEDVASGAFRADLYYRLNVFPITLPPLRDRKEDIPLIAHCMLPKIAARIRKSLTGIDDDAIARMLAYSWPGNVRELLNVLERAAILSSGPELEIGEGLLPKGVAEPGHVADHGPLSTLAEVEERHIRTVLEAHSWVIDGPKGAARILGLHPNTLRSRMAKLAIERP